MKKKFKHFVVHFFEEDCMGQVNENTVNIIIFKTKDDSIKYKEAEIDLSELEIHDSIYHTHYYGQDSLDQWEQGSYHFTCLRIK